MSIKEFAEILNGREYREEITNDEIKLAKQLGYLVVFGASDDLMCLEGVISDELGAYKGTDYYNADLELRISAIWGGDITWSYKTNKEYEEFNIMEYGQVYCRGMVIDLN